MTPFGSYPFARGKTFSQPHLFTTKTKVKKDDYDEVVREMKELKKDPKKREDFMATQAEKALKHWPGRKTR